MAELGAAEGTLPSWAMQLSPRKLSFVQEYLVDFNGRQAALRAGISETDNGASSVAKGLLREPEVVAAIRQAMTEGLQERIRLRQRIIEELSAIAFYDAGDHVKVEGRRVVLTDTDDLTDDQRRAVKRYKQTTGKTECLEVEFHDKVKALETLAKVNGDVAQGGPSLTINNQPVTNEKVLVLTPDELRAAGRHPEQLAKLAKKP